MIREDLEGGCASGATILFLMALYYISLELSLKSQLFSLFLFNTHLFVPHRKTPSWSMPECSVEVGEANLEFEDLASNRSSSDDAKRVYDNTATAVPAANTPFLDDADEVDDAVEDVDELEIGR